MNIYKNFNEEELIDAYINLTDYAGEINDDLLKVINERSDLKTIKEKANQKRIIIKEKGRISFEINQLIKNNKTLDEIDENIKSDILTDQELSDFVLIKYNFHKKDVENRRLDNKTLYKSLIAILLSTFIGVIFLLLIAVNLEFFFYYFLVPLYIFCYFIIKLITGKSRENLFVFISSLVATVLSVVVVILLGFRISK
ncbi:hypothetical protein [Halpernia frigidisoli]|uniref:Uncharacterized protein n=1 Tax=Halpernia frigidisoli TaxID=1125876 RepID=A0A1I3G0K4_9FLAO|nr:hypothetical protein [Halpernia frigidisoli]SFI16832.1 hypothetical protein SAMN05443292_1748 [Halpernia frigidisoli]